MAYIKSFLISGAKDGGENARKRKGEGERERERERKAEEANRWKEGRVVLRRLDAAFTRHSNRRVWDEARSNNLIYEYFAATRNRRSRLRVFRYCAISRK